MGMSLRFFTCLVLTVCIVTSVNASVSCITAAIELAPCINYLRNGGEVPPELCCFGVKNLNSMAQTRPDRQQACRCLQSNSKMIPGLNQTIASGLPKKCGVNIPYPISMDTNCDNVK